jgi:hypothetical protein
MSEINIDKLTPEQEALIPVYREKWRTIALSTERIDFQKAEDAVKAAYNIIGKKTPKILFSSSPYAALNTILSQLDTHQPMQQLQWQLANLFGDTVSRELLKLDGQLLNQLSSQLDNQLEDQLYRQLGNLFGNPLEKPRGLFPQIGSKVRHLENKLWKQFKMQIGYAATSFIETEIWACKASVYNFCISVLNCAVDLEKWEVFQVVVKDCGWIYPCEKICIVCDRPIKVSFDNEQPLHAEGEPIIQFADGFSVYAQ